MALWTPYADTVLDLSKPNKRDYETRSVDYPSELRNPDHPPEHQLRSYDYPNQARSPGYPSEIHSHSYPSEIRSHGYPSPDSPVYHFGYNYAPMPQFSPQSATSVSSYERAFTPLHPAPDRHFSPQPAGAAPTLSPPISPQSHKQPSEDSLSDDPDFQEFERDALRAMAARNGGALLGHNPRMRRNVRSGHDGDDSYRRQRERNNVAAKQSRDRRKLREIHLALKVSYLRRQVAGLKAALASRTCSRCQQSCRC